MSNGLFRAGLGIATKLNLQELWLVGNHAQKIEGLHLLLRVQKLIRFASNRSEFRLVIRDKTFSSAFQEGPVPMLLPSAPTGK